MPAAKIFSHTSRVPLTLLALLALVLCSGQPLIAQDLTAEQDAQLKRYLPRTYPKLLKREPVHVLAIGDSITEVVTPGLGDMPSLEAYFGVFAQRMARFFFYTGEVRTVEPRDGEIDKESPDLGPEVTIENLGMGGRYVYHGMQRIWTDGLQHDPDLILLSFGVNDATSGMPIWEFIAAYRRTLDYLKARKIDVILLGPSLNMTGDAFDTLGITPPYASALEDLARERGLAYFPMAQPTWTSYFDIGGLSADEALDRALKTARTLHIGTDGVFDGLHPNVSAHRRMGDYIWEGLLGTLPQTQDFEVDASYTLDAQGDAEITFTMVNNTSDRRLGYVSVLPFGVAQRPNRTDLPRFDIPAGGKATFKQKLKHWGGEFGPHFSKNYGLLPAHENFVRATFLIMDDRRSQLLTAKAVQSPIGFIWKAGREDRLTDHVNAYALIVNSSKETVAGRYDAQWRGQSLKGEFSVEGGGQQPLVLKFPLEKELYHHDSPLLLTVTLANGQVMLIRRDLEVVRNLTLGKKVPINRWISHPDSDPNSPEHRFEFQVDADATGLTVSAEFSGWEFDEVEGKPMATLSMGIEAQEIGARGLHGFYRKTVAGIPYRGTTPTYLGFMRANFGLTYGERPDESKLRYSMERLSGGHYRVQVFFPRDLFYRHEWNLGSRDSWVGFDLNFTPADKDIPGTFSHENEVVWVKNGISYPDAYGTSVLELTHEPSPYHRSMLE